MRCRAEYFIRKVQKWKEKKWENEEENKTNLYRTHILYWFCVMQLHVGEEIVQTTTATAKNFVIYDVSEMSPMPTISTVTKAQCFLKKFYLESKNGLISQWCCSSVDYFCPQPHKLFKIQNQRILIADCLRQIEVFFLLFLNKSGEPHEHGLTIKQTACKICMYNTKSVLKKWQQAQNDNKKQQEQMTYVQRNKFESLTKHPNAI